MAQVDEPKQTLGSFSGLDGQPLEVIEGEPITIIKITIGKRRLRDNPDAPYAVIIAEGGDVYHTWSEYLIERLAQIPVNALPGETVFRKVVTANKRSVWTLD